MKILLATLVAISLLIGSGCSEKITIDAESQKFMGTWVGKTEISDADMAQARQTMSEESIQELQEFMTIEFELLGDGTYRMLMPMMKVPFKDTWYLDGNTLTLASSGVSGQTTDMSKSMSDFTEEEMTPNGDPMFLGVEANGEELVWRNGAQNTESRFVFKRK